MKEPPPVILVVDDDPSMRKSMARLLSSAGFAVKIFASAAEFLDSGLPGGPACLVLDVKMPGKSGLDLQEEMAARGIFLPIVFITGHGTVPMSVRAMKGGALDFLEKPFDRRTLLSAIAKAVEKDRQARRDRGELAEIERRVASLTPREREVLEGVVAGRLNKQIAGGLGIAEKTVKVHRGRVMEKMRVSSVAELVHLASRAGVCS